MDCLFSVEEKSCNINFDNPVTRDSTEIFVEKHPFRNNALSLGPL